MPGSGWMFGCCGGGGQEPERPHQEPDRVETAFRIMDRNRDGFLTWEEFSRVGPP